jgi:uncharacterized protein (DUF1684 family)
MHTQRLYFILTIAALTACSPKKLTPEEVQSYQSEIEAWHQERLDEVKSPQGWLNLVGLYWLEPGINTFGTAPDNKVIFPEGTIAPKAGYYRVNQQDITFQPIEATIAINGHPIAKETTIPFDSLRGAIFTSGSLEWYILRRDTRLGIRLRDLNSQAVKTFEGIDRYPVDPAYRIEATFERADSTHTIDITNVIGQTTAQSSPGTLVFTLHGQEHRLDALEEGDELFIIFGDETSGKDTYGGGRFVYTDKPNAENKVYIDFNKAHNPPCVFTPYATCPLPPAQNILKTSVEAGEKSYHAEGQSETTKGI